MILTSTTQAAYGSEDAGSDLERTAGVTLCVVHNDFGPLDSPISASNLELRYGRCLQGQLQRERFARKTRGDVP